MSEKLVIVPRKVTGDVKALNTGLFAAACVLIVAATFVSASTFFLPAVIVTGLWAWRNFYYYIEYEYTYYETDVHIAKIINKAKRKNLADLNMDEVITIAPRGDRSVYRYENDKSTKYKDYTSGDKSAKVYELIYKTSDGICRYEFEPDEEMLQAMKIKYPHTVII